MLPVLHIDEEALRPRIERAKRQAFAAGRGSSFREPRALDAEAVAGASGSEVSSRLGMHRERCASCGEPVFLAEKLVVSRSVYHRSCFRCARCRHQLTPGNYYETEDGQYCCEACPEDEPGLELAEHAELDHPPPLPPTPAPQLTSQREHAAQQQQQQLQQQQQQQQQQTPAEACSETALLEAPLSDEEKSKRRDLERLRLQGAPVADDLDQMLELINERIDQLTGADRPAPQPEAGPERRTGLRRSSSLGLVTADPATRLLAPRRRLSLGQRPRVEDEGPAPPARGPADGVADYPDELNPFAGGAEDDEGVGAGGAPTPTPPGARSGNPFGSDDEDEGDRGATPPRPAARTRSRRRTLEAPRICLNPFWSDGEEPGGEADPPVPRPRALGQSAADGAHSSDASIASSCSTLTPGGTWRRKKPAPAPPDGAALAAPAAESPARRSPSPRLTPRTRKSRPAPPPPSPPPSPTADKDKLSKDQANRNTRSLGCGECPLDKSLEGKWKRKKGPAPPRPTPLRRKIKVMSMKDVKLELDQIEMQQQGLERQGVRLEQIIRDKCESGTASEEASLALDVEELVLELFALVNEKNELFRRQAELMLLRRQQRLEEEHADIEYQVRCLITQPEATKTDFDKQREETLIQRLVDIVEKRNEIVECLEMDRRREIEEDRSIHREMDLYAARNKAENFNLADESRRSTLKLKKGKVKEKIKEKKSKKSSKKDADKDVDETETKHKRHTLRKWF
ncbi:MICAL-like protein 2 isoform X2 [Phymastichus coffea]|uniref:MICAL-like protein 2 isoform X2 n=1 Tax=Phymastichus coffea TaxID=108790 RepID=UPI00273AB110|nr:MICAL-like protein 2 isoform X2 [Phymastichus coffea]